MGFERATGKPARYFGPGGVGELLRRLAAEWGVELQTELGHPIGLRRDMDIISLEPGAQVELSTGPLPSVRDLLQRAREVYRTVNELGEGLGLMFYPLALHPLASPAQIEWIPKARYGVMAPFLIRRGRLAHWMMKATGCVQICLDFASEEDAAQKFELAQKLAPFVSAMASASCVQQGRLLGYRSYRSHIWWHTDKARSRFVRVSADPTPFFDRYIAYALEVPMMLLRREGSWYTPPPLTFRQYLERGAYGFEASEEDWLLHLNGLFPQVRLREYLEIRYLDAMPVPLTAGFLALFKGIFYDPATMKTALAALEFFPFRSMVRLFCEVCRKGMGAAVDGVRVLDWTTQILDWAAEGLRNLRAIGASDEYEAAALSELGARLAEEGSPADLFHRRLPARPALDDILGFYRRYEDLCSAVG